MRQNAYFEMAPKARTLLHTKYILLDFNAFDLSRNNLLCRKTRGRVEVLDYAPLRAPGQFDWTKLAHCTSRPCILQNKTIIRPLRHILRICFDKVPLWGPRGSGLDQNCTCTTRPWGQQHETINRSLRY